MESSPNAGQNKLNMTDDTKRLKQREAEKLAYLLTELQREMNEQFEKQGMSNTPIEYKTLVRDDYLSYIEQMYGVDSDELLDVDSERQELREELAALEHQQWREWSRTIAEEEDISEERIERWRDHWVSYDELPDDVKEYDREWADRVMELFYKA